MLKKTDVYLFIAVMCIAAVLYIITQIITATGSAGSVYVYVNAELYGSYPLNRDKVITVRNGGHINVVEIKDGAARMAEADCRDGLCVAWHGINRAYQTIECLPNRVSVRIGGTADIDAVTR